MRAKLLKALRHLKAANAHLTCAIDLVRAGYRPPGEAAARTALYAYLGEIKLHYAEAVYSWLEQAGEP